ncbi:MAG: tetratricopeptide repeat protein, partial [Myxococcota bacterium]
MSWVAVPGRALAWDPFRSANGAVEEGNARMAEGEPEAALEAYDEAARELPSEPGVHLNRGIALLANGQLDRARDALSMATEPPASDAVRADAYYDLGLAFFRQGDAAAQQEEHEEAQRLFREAADAFKRSLRAKPGNRDAGWNLELALRRIEEQKEKEQDQQDQQDDQDQQDQDQDDQDDQDQDDQD